jgi:hypothetical protein
VGALNALWVRERRIERTGRTATLHTELGSWPLRRGVVPDEVPVREVLKGRLRVDDREVQIAGVLDDLYDASGAELGVMWRGMRRRSRCGRRRRATSRCACAARASR